MDSSGGVGSGSMGGSVTGGGQVVDIIKQAARKVGLDENILVAIAAIESSFKTNARSKYSSASGLFQFLDKTWAEITRKAGGKYGIGPGTSRFDPMASSLMAGEYIKQNFNYLKKFKKDLGPVEAYMAHFLGPGGAAKFFKADPNSPAAAVLPKAAASNKSIFFANGRPRTINEIYQHFAQKMKSKAQSLGVSVNIKTDGGVGMASGTHSDGTPLVPGTRGYADYQKAQASGGMGGMSTPTSGMGTSGGMGTTGGMGTSGGMGTTGGMGGMSSPTGGMGSAAGGMGTSGGMGGIDSGIASGVSGAGGGWAGDTSITGGRVSMRRDGGGFTPTVGTMDSSGGVGSGSMGGGFSSSPPDLIGQAPVMGYGTPSQPQPGPPMFDNTVLTTVSGTLTESLSVLKEIRDALLRSEKNAVSPAANDTRSDSAKLKDNYSGKIPQESRNVPQTAISLRRSII